MADRLAIFDLDGTLLVGSKNVMPDLAALLWRSGYRRGRGLMLLVLAGALGIIRKLRLISTETYTHAGTRLLVRWMAGDRLDALTPFFAQTRGRQKIRATTLAELRRRQEEGCICVVVSAVIQPLLEHFAAQWDCNAVGTPVELTADGRLTGRLAGPFCSGPGKVRAVQRWADSLAGPVDWESSHAYGDTLPDLPILQLVGHPTAVAPAPPLRAEADRRGWRVLSE